MPFITANGTIISAGIGCTGHIGVNGNSIPALETIQLDDADCVGGAVLLGPNLLVYQRCAPDDTALDCRLESIDVTTQEITIISEIGGGYIVGSGQGDWAAGYPLNKEPAYRDSLGRRVVHAYPTGTGDDYTGKWCAVIDPQIGGTGIVILDKYGNVETLTEGPVDVDVHLRNNIAAYVRNKTVYFSSGEYSSVRTLGIRHTGRAHSDNLWACAFDFEVGALVVWKPGEEHNALVVARGDQHFYGDIHEYANGSLLLATSYSQGDRYYDLRQTIIDPIAGTVNGVVEERVDIRRDPSSSVSVPGGSTSESTGGIPTQWTAPTGVDISTAYLTRVITDAIRRIVGVEPTTGCDDGRTCLDYWIRKAQNPDKFSDGKWRVGWNAYWEARIECNCDTADPSLAGSEGIIPGSDLWTTGDFDIDTLDEASFIDEPPTKIIPPEPLWQNAAKGITPQLGLIEDDIVYNLAMLAENVLKPVKERFSNVIIVGGFRQANSGISEHERGTAVDLQLQNQTLEQLIDLADFIVKELQFDQLVLNYSQTPAQAWVHVSFDISSLRREVLTRDYDDTFHPGLHIITPLIGEAYAEALREQQSYIDAISDTLDSLQTRENKLEVITRLVDQSGSSGGLGSDLFDCGAPAPVPMDGFNVVTRVFNQGRNGLPWDLSNSDYESDRGCGRFVEAVVAQLSGDWGHLLRAGYSPEAFGHAVDAVVYRSPSPLYNGGYFQLVYIVENPGRPDAAPMWLPTCQPTGGSRDAAPQGGWSREAPLAADTPITTLPQLAYPIADLQTSTWSASSNVPLFSTIDEPGFSDDTDFIESAESDGRLTIELRQEFTKIAEWSLYRTPGSELYEFTVPASQWRVITNWSKLALWVSVNATESKNAGVPETAKLLFGPVDPPSSGSLILRLRIDMGL